MGKIIEIDVKKRKQITEILLTPIICIKWNKSPFIHGNIVYSGQKYYSSLDEDMSDFAVGFYNIVYSTILEGGSMLEGNQLKNKDFAGDTMNSFISIGKYAEFENCNPRIKKAVMDYFQLYHCLANFWVLPSGIGRRSKKLNYYDSMDIFLKRLSDEKEYEEIMGKYGDYKDKMRGYSSFIELHFLEKHEVIDIISYETENVIKLIERATEMIFLRAKKISESDKAGALYEYFKGLGMLQE